MKKVFLIPVFIFIISIVFYSCGPTTAVVTVRPAAVITVRPPAPSPRHIWVSGNYVWRGGRYVWVEGYWAPPRPGRYWVEGHWRESRGGYAWVPGHWAH